MKRSFKEIGSEIGSLVDQKNKAYGSSFSRSADIIKILFPDGGGSTTSKTFPNRPEKNSITVKQESKFGGNTGYSYYNPFF